MYLEAEESAAGKGEVLKDNYTRICNHFGQDLDHFRLDNQLRMLSDVVSDSNPHVGQISKHPYYPLILPQFYCLERSFSTLRRVKHYL